MSYNKIIICEYKNFNILLKMDLKVKFKNL